MKILSRANTSFNLADGTVIVPGLKNYKKIDLNRAVKYQLGILKADKVIDFNELLPSRPHRLPIVVEKQGVKEDAEDSAKEKESNEKYKKSMEDAAKAEAKLRANMKAKSDAKRNAKKPDGSNKKSGKR
jgi:hypothetical protein